MKGYLFAVTVAGSLAFADSAAAQDVSTAAGTSQCELHIWPSGGLRSVYYGWLHGGLTDGAVKGTPGYPKIDGTRLATMTQIKLFSGAKPAAALGRTGYRIVVHEAAPGTRAIRTATGRLSDSAAPCYAELIVEDVFFQQDVFSGSFLRTLFRFRDFGNGQVPNRVFGTWAETRLVHVPPKTPAEIEEAGRELESAFQANFTVFGTALNKPPKTTR